jgi:hypothetical protein
VASRGRSRRRAFLFIGSLNQSYHPTPLHSSRGPSSILRQLPASPMRFSAPVNLSVRDAHIHTAAAGRAACTVPARPPPMDAHRWRGRACAPRAAGAGAVHRDDERAPVHAGRGLTSVGANRLEASVQDPWTSWRSGDGVSMRLQGSQTRVNSPDMWKEAPADIPARRFTLAGLVRRAAYAALPLSSLNCPGGTLSIRARCTSKSSPRRTPP